MQQTIDHRPGATAVALGVLLIAVGGLALVTRELGFNVFQAIGESGWPFFVIVPGLILLGASLVPAPPRGLGFAIPGAIVTTVGGLLLYQSQSGNWESWAYTWALVPMAVGAAMLGYGTLIRRWDIAIPGLWIAGIAAIVLAVGAWYFEGIFAGEPRPVDLGDAWPVVVIAIGGLITALALFGPRQVTPPPSEPTLPVPPATGS
jgi:hypothetical protein